MQPSVPKIHLGNYRAWSILKWVNSYFSIHKINNHRKINTLEEIEILKAASSKYLLNDIIAGQNDPIYKLLPTSVI